MKNTKKFFLVLVAVTFCFGSVANLAAEEEEGLMDTLNIEAGVSASFGLYGFFDLVEDQYEDTWSIAERDMLIETSALISMISSVRMSVHPTVLYPVFEAGILSIDAGGELALGLNVLWGLPLDVAARGVGRFSLTPNDNEGNPGDTIYLQPFIGYYGVAPDVPGALKTAIENDEFGSNEADDVDESDVDGGFGHYFDVGARFGYVLTNGIGAYFDFEYPIGNMSHYRMSFGSTYAF